MTYVIAQPCVDVKDKACVFEFPVDCIYEGRRMFYIHPDECVDCGACDPVCPEEVILYEDDVPAGMASYVRINAEFFGDIGLPRSASSVNVREPDHYEVEAVDSGRQGAAERASDRAVIPRVRHIERSDGARGGTRASGDTRWTWRYPDARRA